MDLAQVKAAFKILPKISRALFIKKNRCNIYLPPLLTVLKNLMTVFLQLDRSRFSPNTVVYIPSSQIITHDSSLNHIMS